MLRRVRRPAVALTAALLLSPALAACGSDSDSEKDKAPKLGAVSIKGDVGEGIEATWVKKLAKPKETTATTLVKGKGAKIATGDQVSTYLWIGNGSTKKAAYDDYENGKPETIPVNAQLNEVFTELLEDQTYGSRVAVLTTANALFGSSAGNQQLGIGPDDNLVVVADLVEKAAVSPTPSSDKAKDVGPGALPKVVEKKGNPAGLDWTGITKPSLTTPVRRVVLKQGTGATLKPTDTVTVNYLGETYKATSPFDASYGKKPLTSPLSGLVQGWSIGLSGVKVGSRVLLEIPPAFGYGAEGSGAIPGNATLWFVIDVVKKG